VWKLCDRVPASLIVNKRLLNGRRDNLSAAKDYLHKLLR